MSAHGNGSPWIVLIVAWVCNVGTALGVYYLACRYGEAFFETRVGSFLLNRKQMKQISDFYDRRGGTAIFVSRFLPTLRAMVPVFAGVTRKPIRKVAPPLAIASGLWYGIVVYAGARAGENFEAIVGMFDRASKYLVIAAFLLGAAIVFWWFRSRRSKD